MTYQIPNKMSHNGQSYEISSRDLANFVEPLLENFDFESCCSACWDGNILHYIVKNDKLYLQHVETNYEGDEDSMLNVKIRFNNNTIRYFKYLFKVGKALNFTGTIIIKNGYRDNFCWGDPIGIMTKWNRKFRYQLVFQDGKLLKKSDTTAEYDESWYDCITKFLTAEDLEDSGNIAGLIDNIATIDEDWMPKYKRYGSQKFVQTKASCIDAMHNGSREALVNLAQMYGNTANSSLNFDEALEWFQQRAESGDVEAQISLAKQYDTYMTGVVESDLQKARYWYEKAAKQGNREAVVGILVLDHRKVSGHSGVDIE